MKALLTPEIKKRIQTAFFLIPVFILSLYSGGWVLLLFVTIILIIAIFELLNLSDIKNLTLRITGIFFLCFTLYGFHIYPQKGSEPLFYILILSLLSIFFLLPLFFKKNISFRDVCILFTGFLWLGIGGGFVILLRDMSFSLSIFFFLFIWIFDTASLIFGRSFGKSKLLQHVSPSKTVEGLVGGVTTAFVYTVVVYLFFRLPYLKEPAQFLLASLIILTSALFGDLAESVIKRNYGFKDSSGIFPGHGGALDRIDSVLLSAPVFYIFLKLLG